MRSEDFVLFAFLGASFKETKLFALSSFRDKADPSNNQGEPVGLKCGSYSLNAVACLWSRCSHNPRKTATADQQQSIIWHADREGTNSQYSSSLPLPPPQLLLPPSLPRAASHTLAAWEAITRHLHFV